MHNDAGVGALDFDVDDFCSVVGLRFAAAGLCLSRMRLRGEAHRDECRWQTAQGLPPVPAHPAPYRTGGNPVAMGYRRNALSRLAARGDDVLLELGAVNTLASTLARRLRVGLRWDGR